MRIKAMMVGIVLVAVSWAWAQNVNVSGTWNAKTVSPRGTFEQTITFTQSGDSFTGEMVNSSGVKETISGGRVSGNSIEFNVERKQASGEVSKVAYKGTVDGNEIKGTFTGASGATVNWTATKESAGGHDMGSM